MELLKISDRNYIPVNSIIKISIEDTYMYLYYQRGNIMDYHRTIIRGDHTVEQEIQSRLVTILPTKGPVNAI